MEKFQRNETLYSFQALVEIEKYHFHLGCEGYSFQKEECCFAKI